MHSPGIRCVRFEGSEQSLKRRQKDGIAQKHEGPHKCQRRSRVQRTRGWRGIEALIGEEKDIRRIEFQEKGKISDTYMITVYHHEGEGGSSR